MGAFFAPWNDHLEVLVPFPWRENTYASQLVWASFPNSPQNVKIQTPSACQEAAAQTAPLMIVPATPALSLGDGVVHLLPRNRALEYRPLSHAGRALSYSSRGLHSVCRNSFSSQRGVTQRIKGHLPLPLHLF